MTNPLPDKPEASLELFDERETALLVADRLATPLVLTSFPMAGLEVVVVALAETTSLLALEEVALADV